MGTKDTDCGPKTQCGLSCWVGPGGVRCGLVKILVKFRDVGWDLKVHFEVMSGVWRRHVHPGGTGWG